MAGTEQIEKGTKTMGLRVARWGAVAAMAVLAAAGRAESKNPADYPLRIHIFGRSQTSFYRHEWLDTAQGEGRANLFENGEPHAVDFSYNCTEKIRASFGYETYPARWRKAGKELAVLFPMFGQAGKYYTCDLKTDVKDFAYTRHNGSMGQEPVPAFRHWMETHDYDPEHGKDMPVKPAGAGAPAASAEGAPEH